MFLPLFERISNSTGLFAAVFVAQIASMCVMQKLLERLDSGRADSASGGALPPPPPDLRFGFTSDELYDWFDAIGDEGLAAYRNMYRFDLFPYMQLYAVSFGTLLYRLTKQSGSAVVPPRLALIFPVAAWFDFFETLIPARASELYAAVDDRGQRRRQRVSENLVQVASLANQCKWVCFGIGMLSLSLLFLYNTAFVSGTAKSPTTKTATTAAASSPTQDDNNNGRRRQQQQGRRIRIRYNIDDVEEEGKEEKRIIITEGRRGEFERNCYWAAA